MLNRLLSLRPFSVDIGLLLIRFVLGFSMLSHGYPKLIHFSEQSAEFSDPFGIGPAVSMSLAVFAEFFCSLLLAAGLFTRLALIPLIITMATAAFVIHGGDPFGVKEKALLYLVPYIALFLSGPGHWSLDRLLKK